MEKTKHGERIARYSGKLLSREEAEASSSQYIVQVTKDKFLDGAGEDEWKGRPPLPTWCAESRQVRPWVVVVSVRLSLSLSLRVCMCVCVCVYVKQNKNTLL